MTGFAIDDLVITPDGKAGVVVDAYPGADALGPIYDVANIHNSVRMFYTDELTGVPTPEPGQRWRCISRPDLVLEVVSTHGVTAECVTGEGRWVGDVVLPGLYEPEADR